MLPNKSFLLELEEDRLQDLTCMCADFKGVDINFVT